MCIFFICFADEWHKYKAIKHNRWSGPGWSTSCSISRYTGCALWNVLYVLSARRSWDQNERKICMRISGEIGVMNCANWIIQNTLIHWTINIVILIQFESQYLLIVLAFCQQLVQLYYQLIIIVIHLIIIYSCMNWPCSSKKYKI